LIAARIPHAEGDAFFDAISFVKQLSTNADDADILPLRYPARVTP
jgi:hypothetical protein